MESKRNAKKGTKIAKQAEPSRRERARVSQADVPSYSLDQALRVAKAIGDNYAYKPTKPLNVAAAMKMQPSSSTFRMLCGAALAYGLTSGGAFAPEIGIESLGMRIIRPTSEGDDDLARREALLKPRVIGEFLRKYDGASIPREDIAMNVLLDMGVPSEKTKEVLDLILEGAAQVGFIQEIKGRRYVNLDGASTPSTVDRDDAVDEVETPLDPPVVPSASTTPLPRAVPMETAAIGARRVFITHGKNKALIEPIKKLLGFGEMEPVVSTEKQSVSQPVPDKVMNDMRSCAAAIIHVDAELQLIDQEAKEHVVLNPNVLIEIGAAMALYGRRFILLVKEGVQLPSNLQGLYEVRYAGETLDGTATIKLLEAINEMKKHPVLSRYDAVAGAVS